MTLTFHAERPPLRADATGTIRVGASRVTLDTLIAHYRAGETPERIADAFPAVSLSEVYGTISFYLKHRPELDRYLEDREREAQATRRESEADPATQQLKRKLLEQRRSSR